jgi:hypothetical protein
MRPWLTVAVLTLASPAFAGSIQFTDRDAFEALLDGPTVIDLTRPLGSEGLDVMTQDDVFPFGRIWTFDGLASFNYDRVGFARPPIVGLPGGTLYEASILVPVLAAGVVFTPFAVPCSFSLPLCDADPLVPFTLSFFGTPYTFTAPTFLGIVFDEPTVASDWLNYVGGQPTAVRLSDFTVQTVAEPATGLLFTLGGVFLLTRRRRHP